ncbi:MAG: type II toxin-antitoxin system PemK/MazF family toxin [bacterium]
MTTFRQGEIVLVPFPFTDQTTVKQRPAVIVSSNEYNLSREDVIIAAITSVVNIIWVRGVKMQTGSTHLFLIWYSQQWKSHGLSHKLQRVI